MNIKTTWSSPSNIALVKYWGKFGEQFPMNPSISFTLSESKTITSAEIIGNSADNKLTADFYFEGKENKAFAQRINKFLHRIVKYFPAIQGLHLKIDSKNTFPHSSGIASSASALSALALCLVDLEKELTGEHHHINDFYKKASFIARLGSGSAARSVYGGIIQWGETKDIAGSSNEYAIDINESCDSAFKNYGDAILIISDAEKKVSSTLGHGLMNNHPFANEKFKQAFSNTKKLQEILRAGNQKDFALLVEQEALALHAMMMTSTPPFLLMEANTIAVIEEIQKFRKETNIPVCFTLDAGANVHLLYPGEYNSEIKTHIKSNLQKYCVNGLWIDDKVGSGPEKL